MSFKKMSFHAHEPELFLLNETWQVESVFVVLVLYLELVADFCFGFGDFISFVIKDNSS